MMDVRLIMFRGDGTRREFVLPSGASTIGRKDDCTVRIPLNVVSRRHAEIFVDQGGVVLKDLGSANGTYLNNQKIDEEDIEPGDQIVIGPVVFTVQLDGQPADDELVEIRSKLALNDNAGGSGASLDTSKHVYMSDEETDPISALEALASSADQTVIDAEDDE